MPEADGGSRIDMGRVDAAITQVLQAERDAREDVQRCALAAERMIEQAQERARRIAIDAANRTVRVQRWSAVTLQQRLDALAERQALIGRYPSQGDAPSQLRLAVEALATQLTGAGQ
jgi:vacuolar-type H+-ATPase subunit H